jgi:hypothetical protein
MFLSDVGVCATGERSGTAEGERVPSGGSFVRSLLKGVEVADGPSPVTEGVKDDLLGRPLEALEAARRLAMSSCSRRWTLSAALSPDMIDGDEVGTGVQGRDGSLDS